jgi:predicted polyphosphate/ATP-dependent NAD kinase
LVGIIANPASGKDIRRLVASATTIDNREKVSILQRVLPGLGVMGVTAVAIMPDSYHMGERMQRGLPAVDHPLPTVTLLDQAVTERAQDSIDAAVALRQMGARVIVVLGGDGTTRVVSKGSGDVPLLPISTGTNNVLPTFVEGTIAGLAAGAVATAQVPSAGVTLRHKWLEIAVNGEPRDRALVDAAVVVGRFVGARAIWNRHDLRLLVVTRGQPMSIGISAIAGMVRPIAPDEPLGLALTLAQPGRPATRCVRAALGPGLIPEIEIAEVAELAVGATLGYSVPEPSVVALDGEREILLKPGDRVDFTLRADGPPIILAQRVMEAVTRQRLLACDR